MVNCIDNPNSNTTSIDIDGMNSLAFHLTGSIYATQKQNNWSTAINPYSDSSTGIFTLAFERFGVSIESSVNSTALNAIDYIFSISVNT